MGCTNDVQIIKDKMMLLKLERMEIQMAKEKELKKLSDIEGRPIKAADIPDYIDQEFHKETYYIDKKKKDNNKNEEEEDEDKVDGKAKKKQKSQKKGKKSKKEQKKEKKKKDKNKEKNEKKEKKKK